MDIDRVSWLDPALLSLGFFIVLTCFMLSQFIREHPLDFIRSQGHGLVFWLIRKVLLFAMFEDLVLGFWVVGWLWLIIAPALLLVAAVLTNVCMSSLRPGRIIRIASIIGILIGSWAQSPLLKAWVKNESDPQRRHCHVAQDRYDRYLSRQP